jgi:hypothetical protein
MFDDGSASGLTREIAGKSQRGKMSFVLKVTRHLARTLPGRRTPKNRQSSSRVVGRPRVLVIGIYLAEEANYIEELVGVFSGAAAVDVEQRWVCMEGIAPSKTVAAVTVRELHLRAPKWPIVNELISREDVRNFDYVMVCDDDALLAKDFVDRFIAEQQCLDFALAQPARTWRSYTDHPIVRRRLFIRARETNFVEIGPVVSFRRDFLSLVLPFGPESPMGWGYDLTWPVVASEHGFAIGIIDGVPVDHDLRRGSALYDYREQRNSKAAYLSHRPHVREDLVSAIRTYR